jgi:hypothetical protein
VSAHVKAQLLRFVRTSALAFVAALFQTDGRIGWASLWAMIAGAGETGLRQLIPVAPVPAASAVPAAAASGSESSTTDPASPAKG